MFNKQFSEKHTWFSLIIVALACGILWRVEVEYHGWKGLIWLSYFHYAIPVGFGLFLLWVNWIVSTNWKTRMGLNLFLIGCSLLLYYALEKTFIYNYSRGPLAMALYFLTPKWQFYLYRYLIIIAILIVIPGAYFILRINNLYLPKAYFGISVLGFIAAIPVSLLILSVSNHKGGSDIIHAFKSGVVIPFLVVSLGILFIGIKSGK